LERKRREVCAVRKAIGFPRYQVLIGLSVQHKSGFVKVLEKIAELPRTSWCQRNSQITEYSTSALDLQRGSFNWEGKKKNHHHFELGGKEKMSNPVNRHNY